MAVSNGHIPVNREVAMTASEMTDEQLLGYAEFHSQTPRALFPPDLVRRLVVIIYGEETAKRVGNFTWRSLHYENIKDELELGRRRLREKARNEQPLGDNQKCKITKFGERVNICRRDSLEKTYERSKVYFRAQWSWMAKHPGAEEDDWPGFAAIRHSCFGDIFTNWDCFYANYKKHTDGHNGAFCNLCPTKEATGGCSDYNHPRKILIRIRTRLKKDPYARDDENLRSEWRNACLRMRDSWQDN